MVAKTWSKLLGSLAILQVLSLAGVMAEDLIIRNNVQREQIGKRGLQDYIEQNDRQYLAQIDSYEVQTNNFRASYDRQINALAQQEDFLVIDINQIDQSLYPLELLNDLTKYCVQKYRSILVTVATVRTAYAKCITTAKGYINSILQTPDAYTLNLKNYYNGVNYKGALADCEKKNAASYENQTICVTNVVSKANAYFYTNQVNFKKSLEASQCTADNRIREGVECVFKVNNSTMSANGSGTRLIDDCISGIELCDRCQPQANNTIILPSDQCSNVIDIAWRGDIFKNATIRNPFYGLSNTVNCLLINFQQPA